MNDVELEMQVCEEQYRALKELRRAAKYIEQAMQRLDALRCDYVTRSDVEADLEKVDSVLHNVKFAVISSNRTTARLKHIKACGAIVEN